MVKNKLLQKQTGNGISVIRVLDVRENEVFVIDCIKRTMPVWVGADYLSGYEACTEETLQSLTNRILPDEDSMDRNERTTMYRRFTMIAGILSFPTDEDIRNRLIATVAEENGITRQTVRNYLCLYLIYQNITALAPKRRAAKELTPDEKNMRWGLNKFFYTKNKNSLNTAYTMMIKEKYCDDTGKLLPEYPSFNQFRYFYRKHKNMRTFYITRDGLKSYERNSRPLLGDGIRKYASHVGIGMFDATICDIYLTDDCGNLVGRPILTACVDAYSGLCMGYALSWEGGVYSLRGLLLNIITDKKEHCKKYGILIDEEDWNCCSLPAEFVTDMGSEYVSGNFEQISDLGVTVVNLPSYRPELKGMIEKFFDCIQGYFKPYLKGKGMIEPDYRERGSRDYRKDACLTMNDFEKIVIRCIIYYNSKRVIENFPCTDEMMKAGIKPFANKIWGWGKEQRGANLIETDAKTIIFTLLPRTEGKFTRYGLKVNKMRYCHKDYTEQYLTGGSVTVAYNPDDVSEVWLIENGRYVRFELIESGYKGKPLAEVAEMQNRRKEIVKRVEEENLQAKIDLAEHIRVIAESKTSEKDVNIKEIRKTKKREQRKTHVDYVKGGRINA